MTRPTLPLSRRRAFLFGVIAVATFSPSFARASDSITGELGGGLSKPTPTIASAPFEYQKVAGRYQASDTLSIINVAGAGLYLPADLAAIGAFNAGAASSIVLQDGTTISFNGPNMPGHVQTF